MAGAVYWIGADGNIYTKGLYGEVGVHNEGKALYPGDLPGSYTAAGGHSGKATEIADPNPGNKPAAAAAPGNPNGGGGGTAAPVLPDKSNDIALQNAGLGAVDQQTAAGQAAIAKALAGITGQYDTEAANNQTKYKTNSDQNENNLQKNKQTSLVNAAQGRQGLFGTLASLGALNGSGIDLANNAVQHGANEDLSGAENTFGTNQSGLDTAINDFKTADAQRRKDAQTASDNANTNIQNQAAQNKLTAYKALADDYSAEGNAGEAQRYTGLASSLLPTIAQTSIPSSNLAPEAAAFTAPSLASYIAGSNPTSVATTPANKVGGVPGLITDPSKKKAAPLVAAAATP